jgi:DNA invertase Pin-like site-specific DNA recombinase
LNGNSTTQHRGHFWTRNDNRFKVQITRDGLRNAEACAALSAIDWCQQFTKANKTAILQTYVGSLVKFEGKYRMSQYKYIAYYRVSTARQGRSGLGLDAQCAAVRAFLRSGKSDLLAEFTEVESGRRKNRPQLLAALAACRKHKATLLIAKLDRLARNVAFVANLMESKIGFRAVDMPDANELTIHIMAAMAQHEAKATSDRTRAALAAARTRGRKLGRHGKKLAKKNRAAAEAFARRIAPTVRRLRKQHLTLQGLAGALNGVGVRTSRNGEWYATSVRRLLDRLDRIAR